MASACTSKLTIVQNRAVLQLQLNELLLRLLVFGADTAAADGYCGCLVGMRHCMFGTCAESASPNA